MRRWIDQRDAAGEFDGDTFDAGFVRWFAFGGGAFGDLPRGTVGLQEIANHDLKTFCGITERLKTLR